MTTTVRSRVLAAAAAGLTALGVSGVAGAGTAQAATVTNGPTTVQVLLTPLETAAAKLGGEALCSGSILPQVSSAGVQVSQQRCTAEVERCAQIPHGFSGIGITFYADRADCFAR